MLAVPVNWYAMVPGVADTGPFNPHFVRDIGVGYVVTGTTRVWFAKRPAARSAAQAAAFLALHTAVHVWDVATAREHAHQLVFDVSTVFLPPGALDRLVAFYATVQAGKEKSDDQMVSAAVDQQVRTHLEL